MQALPLRDEVREARRRSKEAEAAMTLSQQVGIALSAVSVTERQVRGMDVDDVELPGGELVKQAIEAYPELAGLADIAPDPQAPLLKRLEQRRVQLRTIDQVIRPLASQLEERAHKVHELQHEQYQILQKPEYEELREQLNTRHATRSRCNMALGRLRGRRQSLMPAERAVEMFLPQAEQELARPDDGFNREMARGRLLTLVETLDTTARVLGLEVSLPDLSKLNDPDCDDDVLHEAARALHVLQDAARVEVEELDAEIERLEAELEEATDWMLAVTG